MLVLARKKGEALVIGDQIEIVVLGVEGDVVKLGVSAPKSVDIHRKEVFLSIQRSNLEASQARVNASDLKSLLGKREPGKDI